MKRVLTQNNSVVLQEIASNGVITLQLGYALGGITYKIENQNVKFYLKDDYFYKNCIFSADLPLNIDGRDYDEDHIAEVLGNMFPINGGGGGGGDVVSVNGKRGIVVLTADDVDAYTKDEVDDLIDGLETEIEGIEGDIDNLEEQIPEKATTAPLMDGTATIGESNKYAAEDHIHPTDTSRASQSDLEALSNSLADNYYTKSETYNKTEIDTALGDKQGTLTAGANITIDSNNVISATGGGGTQVQTDWNQTNTTAVDYIKNKPTNVSSFTNDAGYLTQHQSLTEYYTKSEIDTALGDKQDTLTAGTNITIENNVISATGGGGTQIQSDWNQSDNTQVDYIKNKPTIPDVSNYYTKTESDNKFALKFTDVDDIVLVNTLPSNPNPRTLYLIPSTNP